MYNIDRTTGISVLRSVGTTASTTTVVYYVQYCSYGGRIAAAA